MTTESTPQDDSSLSVKTYYEQGSVSCQNYSRLTMKVKTLTLQSLVLGTAGFLTLYYAELPVNIEKRAIIFISGIVLLVFSTSLWLICWHYQSAFEAIRNKLSELEEGKGPWSSHLEVRKNVFDHFTSYLPFLLINILSGVLLYHSGHPQIGFILIIIYCTIFINGLEIEIKSN